MFSGSCNSRLLQVAAVAAGKLLLASGKFYFILVEIPAL
jgi:hypothetical protein